MRIAEWERDSGTCRIHGGPLDECGDDERDWFPQRSVCWPSAQLEAAKRRYAAIHEDQPFHDGTFANWSKEASLAYPFHLSDGVSFWMSPVDLSPDDDFLEQTSAAQEPGGD